jgi:hypothetical protein
MKQKSLGLELCLLAALCGLPLSAVAQENAAAVSTTTAAAVSIVPKVVNFGGTLTDLNNRPLTDVTGVTFLLYKESTGGSPLWMETQSVQPNKSGHYSVVLGSTTSQGLPTDVFVSGEARWLGVQVQGQTEQPRVLLVAVPYALKAHDAETIGGLPPSAFMLAPAIAAGSAAPAGAGLNPSVPPPATVTGSGTADFVPLWTSTSALTNSVLFQTGSGSAAKIGINSTTPAATLDVNGGTTVRGLLNLPNAATATAAAGADSRPFGFVASVFNSGTASASNQVFHWQAEPVNNNKATASATLNLLFAVAPAAAAETGLKINTKGQFTFAAGQTFPGTGTVSSVSSGAGLTGGPITTSGTLSIASAGVTNAMLQHSALTVNPGTDLTGGGSVALGGSTTLNLDTTKVPTLAGSNVFSASQSLNGGALLGNSIQAADGTFSLLVNSVDCCTFGTRMVWAHSPAFPNWGIFYDDSTDFMHIRRQAGGEILTVNFGGLVGINKAAPTQALDVNGSITTNASIAASGSITANTITGDARGTFGSSTATGTGQALIVDNANGSQTLQVQNFSATPASSIFAYAQFDVNGKATFFTDDLGDTTAAGTKSAAVPLASGEMVKVFSTESPEVWFEDYGFGQLSAGVGKVTIDPSFTQTASMTGYHVFVTPKGDCKGLYVTNETDGTFEVREIGGGQSNIEFDYRIVAHRRGYEAVRLPAAQMPKPVATVPETPKERKISLPPATVAPNPQLLYRASAPVHKLVVNSPKK